ncbi:flagellin [Desulfosarcina alkanivorans]|uniref:Flagellin n=1 Tax=Desulfosarcina alkanivorans TaxID=571177 RepID=A0A5K7YBH6_9BACT|nr:flagellin [Desulfosarcina alkanivorans]BBO66752.1 flagellin [Desulfosarcina alkanivorans]
MAIALTAGMRANLTSLQNTTSLMENTQKKLSSGKKVNTALDDPVNFFKAKDHNDRARDLSAKKDGMKEAIKTIEAANTGIESMYDMLDQMKSLASAAKTSDNTSDLKTQFDAIRGQVQNLAEDSKYGGKNLLGNDALQVEFDENGSNKLSVQGIDAKSQLGEIRTASTTKTIAAANFDTSGGMESAIVEIDSAVKTLRTEAQKLASSLSTISIREDFTNNMINTLNTGADQLTLADMNEEGANMLMLQTRQQLGTTSLSMSSQAAQAVLRLF